ncbi:hypothetical protein K490DRAFT_22675, partial [Saccharata proteae CBS 121410]
QRSEFVGVAKTKEEKGKQPWRYLGYPAFSAWLDADNDNFVLRRFGTLHARTLLMLQNEIVGLERRLANVDKLCMFMPSVRKDEQYLVNNSSFENDKIHHRERWDILRELTCLLEQYEAQFIKKEKDLIAMVHREKTFLRRMLGSCLWLRGLVFSRVRVHYGQFSDTDETIFYDDTSVDILITVIILFLGLGMLLGPVWWLQNTASLTHRLGIICIFVPLFMILLLLVTAVRPFETVAATSAYAALLMVFMQM